MGKFREFFTGLFNLIKTPLDGIKKSVTDALNERLTEIKGAMGTLTSKLDSAVKTPLGTIKTGVEGVKTELGKSIGGPITSKIEAVFSSLKEVRDKVVLLTTAISGFKSDMGTQLTTLKTSMFAAIKQPLDTLGGIVTTGLGIVSTAIKEAVSGAAGIISEPLKSIKENMPKVADINKLLDELGESTKNKAIAFHIERMQVCRCVSALNSIYNAYPKFIKDYPGITEYYNTRKMELEGEGMSSFADLGLGLMGTQIFKAVEAIEKKALPKITGWIEEFGKEYDVPDIEIERMNKLAGSGEFGLNAVVSFVLGVTVQPAISVATAPVWEAAGQKFWDIMPVRLLDTGTLIRLKYKGLITDKYFNEQLSKQGFDTEAITAFVNDFKFVPTAGDVIRWSVREAFYEDYVRDYGLDAEYPNQLTEYGKLLGMDIKELKYFWRSHWELPSTYQGFEMLHRDVITSKDLDSLFMANDIMPFWREKLAEISYAPYTRVDIRRMFKSGIIGREKVKRGYLDRGYDDEHAENLTMWTVSDTIAKERDLTRGNIEKLYKEGQITRETATEYLMGLRYDKDETEYLLSLVDLQISDEMEKDLIHLWNEQFKLHEIDIKGLESNLDSLSITTEKKKRIVNKAKLLELGFITKPSKADLIKWFVNNIITKDKFTENMKGLGYTDEAIGNYIKDAKTGGE